MKHVLSTITLLAMTAFTTVLGTLRFNDGMNSDEQKQPLEQSINTTAVLNATSTESEAPTLQQNLQNGSQLILSDGSTYAIAPSDQSKTELWLIPTSIQISDSGDPLYPILLTNSLTGVSVKAQLVKDSPPVE